MPRGGTTFLYHNLHYHKGVFLPFRKEVSYFGTNFNRGEQWYLDLYENIEEGQIPGDISPTYFMHDQAAQRIYDYNPNVKVILTVRDPVEWALSFYEQFASFDRNMPSFEEFVNGNYKVKLGDEFVTPTFKDNFILKRIEEYRSLFGKNLLIYDFAYFANNRQKVLQIIESFLGVEPFFHKGEFDDMQINASHRKNNQLVSYLLSREWLISIINKIFPRTIIISSRSLFDRISVRHNSNPNSGSAKERNRMLAEKELSEQRQNLKDLFKDAPVILGNGKPFGY